MNRLLLAPLFFAFLPVLGQKIVTQKIWTVPVQIKTLYVEQVTTDSSSAVNLFLMGQNMRYSQIVDNVTVFKGSPAGFRDFCADLDRFFTENLGKGEVKENRPGYTLAISNAPGLKYVSVWDAQGRGYLTFYQKNIAKMREAFEAWAAKNGY